MRVLSRKVPIPKNLETYLMILVYKQELALNNPQELICHKAATNQSKNVKSDMTNT